jgi:hypothetical protein
MVSSKLQVPFTYGKDFTIASRILVDQNGRLDLLSFPHR